MYICVPFIWLVFGRSVISGDDCARLTERAAIWIRSSSSKWRAARKCSAEMVTSTDGRTGGGGGGGGERERVTVPHTSMHIII